jgi:alkanesulfonate monooxygenase SsuD/methylene tetrahydromethanopterin reductase-like flavin-dependent oxidoreductase (luciferase family)
MLRVAGEWADGVVTWMTGPKTLADHIVPGVSAAAESAGRGSPRVVAGALVCVTEDEAGVRGRVEETFDLAGRVPEYRATLDREGAAGPADVAVIGGEDTVARELARLADAGVTELVATPFGDAAEQERTIGVLAELHRTSSRGAAASPARRTAPGRPPAR